MKTIFNVASIIVCAACFTFSCIATFHLNVFNNSQSTTKATLKSTSNKAVCSKDSSKDSLLSKGYFEQRIIHKQNNIN